MTTYLDCQNRVRRTSSAVPSRIFPSSFQLSELRIVWRSYRRVLRELNIVRGHDKRKPDTPRTTIGQEGVAKQLENPNNHSLMSRLFFNHFLRHFPRQIKQYVYILFFHRKDFNRENFGFFFRIFMDIASSRFERSTI